jgi:cyclic beta-1,2-glucan synthetase
MYRAGIEGILGFRRRGMELSFEPCIPKAWAGFEITYRFQSTTYHVTVTNPQGVMGGIVQMTLDDQERPHHPASIPLVDDGRTHQVHLTLG